MASEVKKPHLGSVMVIGGCGFLGHHVVNLLLRDYDAAVTVVDLKCTRHRRPDADGVRYVEADISDAAALGAAFEQAPPDVVIHTASPAPHANAAVANALFTRVNVDGTRCVVEACQKAATRALVYTSSASVLSDNKSDLVNADEQWPVIRGKDQTEYYTETKVRNLPVVFPRCVCRQARGGSRRRRIRGNKVANYLRRPKPSPSSWPPTRRRRAS